MKRKIRLNDVLLRESAQVAGGAMSPRDQLTYVEYLILNGIDAIEIGFPGSNPDQLKQCQRIVKFVKEFPAERKPQLAGLARALKADIDAVKNAGCDICHIYIPVSNELMMAQFDAAKYGDTEEGKRNWIVDQAKIMVAYAREIGFEQVEFSPEDAARTSPGFLFRVVGAVISAGATIVNIPDTTGLRVGSEFGDLIKDIFASVPSADTVIISVHCHNDSDHATHNALQAILSGAGQIEGTFYGLGERSGMTKFESVIMNVSARDDIFGHLEIGFNKAACVKIVNFVGSALGMPVPRHWTVVGEQNSICSSGTHQAIEARAKKQGKDSAYYSWKPEEYGHEKVEQVITQSSGREGLDKRLEMLGYKISSAEEFEKIFEQVKKISSKKSGASINDRELTAIVQDVVAVIPFRIKVEECQTIGGRGTIPSATVTVEAEGRRETVAEIGDGAFDAVMKAVRRAVSEIFPALKKADIELDHFSVTSITSGSEALADVYARIKVSNGEDMVFVGRGVDEDTIQASAQAFANCFSWYLARSK